MDKSLDPADCRDVKFTDCVAPLEFVYHEDIEVYMCDCGEGLMFDEFTQTCRQLTAADCWEPFELVQSSEGYSYCDCPVGTFYHIEGTVEMCKQQSGSDCAEGTVFFQANPTSPPFCADPTEENLCWVGEVIDATDSANAFCRPQTPEDCAAG